jgi:hypothetical protein
MRTVLLAVVAALLSGVSSAALAEGAYGNFKAAIYIPVNAARELADPATREQQYQRIATQLRFDKVYLEDFRGGQFADEASLDQIKKFFTDKGIQVSGGITLAAAGHGGQFGTFDYENAQDRAECRRAVEMAARHFDEIILDDFFFYTTKSDADIAAKGKRSWTQYRLERMREVAENLVLKPARAINPRVRVIIKYPNWYEHFQGLGYDLDVEAKKFDFIYTGTETRDPEITDQLLQQYESYLVFRYFDNVRPQGGNRGGWVDTYDTRYVDRYAEQLWDTLFAKAPEITLFNWHDLASPEALVPGDRQAWSAEHTSFDWEAMVHSAPTPHANSPQLAAPGWARAAGFSLEQADRVLGRLGKPIGIASYKPYQSSGEDYLPDYLGNLGIPIELTPEFPAAANLVLLTESAREDPQIMPKIEHQLAAGKSVAITSGLLHALQDRGIRDIVELEYTSHKIAVHEFIGAFGAGRGTSLNEPGKFGRDILFPELRFYTNDSWPLIRGVANEHGVPILLMNRYSRGVLYVLDIPDNIGDLYALPQPVTKAIRSYLQADFPVRLDAPAQVSLFAYDNGTFIVESFRPEAVTVSVSITGSYGGLRDLVSGQSVTAEPVASATAQTTAADSGRNSIPGEAARTSFQLELPPHSYRVFQYQ